MVLPILKGLIVQESPPLMELSPRSRSGAIESQRATASGTAAMQAAFPTARFRPLGDLLLSSVGWSTSRRAGADPAEALQQAHRRGVARIDLVLITHSHADHLVLETLLQLRHRIDTIVVPRSGWSVLDPSLALLLRRMGFASVREVDAFESIAVKGGEVLSAPFLGEHADLAIRAKSTYLVRLGTHAFFFGADANNLEPTVYERAQNSMGNIDVRWTMAVASVKPCVPIAAVGDCTRAGGKVRCASSAHHVIRAAGSCQNHRAADSRRPNATPAC